MVSLTEPSVRLTAKAAICGTVHGIFRMLCRLCCLYRHFCHYNLLRTQRRYGTPAATSLAMSSLGLSKSS